MDLAEHALSTAMDCADAPTRRQLIVIARDCLDIIETMRRWTRHGTARRRHAS
jgi:hypothetical protein